MGFGKLDLHFVIHSQYPGSIIGYYQQIGRAGRGIDRAQIILMYGTEDEEIQTYFIETAFPTPEKVEETVHLLQEAGELSLDDLQKEINVRVSTLEKILLHLEIDRIIEKDGPSYRLLDSSRLPDFERWQRVTQQRYDELEQMKAYLQHKGCLMQFIAKALDDPTHVQPCKRCKNCRGHESSFVPQPQDIIAASEFLKERQTIYLKTHKVWPKGFSEEFQGRMKIRNAKGIALCYYHDPGWGEYVRRGKYSANCFADDLVRASAELLRDHWVTIDDPPTWVTAVPSLRRPNLVPDFASRLANYLHLPYLSVVHQIKQRPEQKMMKNRRQQLGNLWGTLKVEQPLPGPVLLVDDISQSGWTFTLIGALLHKNGSGTVHPFALARVEH